MTNFGLDQVTSIPPKWWRRLERAVLIFVLPATTTFLTIVVTDPDKEVQYLTIITFVAALFKSFGIFLGSSEDYPKSETKEDDNHLNT
jgi:hypothetical protein